ncbi:MAG TPA: ribosome silencing factor [Desulfurivibrionaceae bacterium]|nr:ribosome silencing factor [Desulfurivibrionaceae bacterium]
MKKIQKKYRDLPAEELLRIICRLADDQKAQELLVLDVRGLASFADYFVLLSGTSTRHVQGLADAIDGEIGSKRMKSGDTEGLNDGNWVLLDYNDIVVHVFHHETRSYYDLEGLWHDAPRVDPLTLPAPREEADAPAGKPARKRAVPRQVAGAGEPDSAPARKSAVSEARKTARAIKIAASKTKSAAAKKASIIAKKSGGTGKGPAGARKTGGGMRRPAAPTKKRTGPAGKKAGSGRK